jgi:hypothetical protein
MSAEAISGGSAPNEEPSESDLERSEYANEACDLLADAVGIGRRNCWVALESAEETDSDDCKGDAEAAWVSCVKGDEVGASVIFREAGVDRADGSS